MKKRNDDLFIEKGQEGKFPLIKMNSEFEDEILDLIDNRDDFTRSDLQGIVSALVMKIRRSKQSKKVQSGVPYLPDSGKLGKYN